jgi:hypothetical protein
MLRSNSKIRERNAELQSREGMQRLRKCVQIFGMNTNAWEEAAEMHKNKDFFKLLCYQYLMLLVNSSQRSPREQSCHCHLHK